MRVTPRMRKVNETVKEALAEVLETEVSDPRLELVTITGADVAADLRTATVYVIAHGGEERYAEVLAGLASATHRIRRALGARIRTKYLPHLDFRIDPSIDEAMRIYEALKEVPPHVEEVEDR